MASKRRLRRKSCEGKQRYENVGHATKEMHKRGWKGVNAYGCKFCKGIHIGHQPRWVQVKRGII